MTRELEQWVAEFDRALTTSNSQALADLFFPDSHWRDNGALTWDFHQHSGRDAVVDQLLSAAGRVHPRDWRLSVHWPSPVTRDVGEEPVIEAFFDFETDRTTDVALLHARLDPSSPCGVRAFALYTRIEGLKNCDQRTINPRGKGFEPVSAHDTWAAADRRSRSYDEHQPDVLVVGAGQAGLMVSAYLRRLGVDVLIADTNARVGDNWRHRYESLHLHNPIEMNGFPLLPFPEHYPEYLPKDLMAEWLEMYSRYFGLNVWTSTSFLGADYDDTDHQWRARLRRGDGTERELRPKHIVLATGGTGGRPRVPQIAGLSSFAGQVCHSSKYTVATDYDITNAIVVGTGSSGHDIALDLHNHGVTVTMMQRSGAVVNAIDTANGAYAEYFDPAVPTELVDIRYGIALINPLRESASRSFQDSAKVIDKDLHDGLTAAGMRLSDGVDGRGFLDLFLRTGGGYYFNVGASDAIIDGGIAVVQSSDFVEFTTDGARMADGRTIAADLVVLATGYEGRRTEVDGWFGPEVAARVGDVARLDAQGEWANVWSQTPQRGLWFNGGGINQARPGSKILALLIKADLDGAIPDDMRRSPHHQLEPDAPLSVGVS
ncbi:NAD(P)/FAD-dependent oxidoreductase [Mycolicibacterium sp. 3033]|nr:NAD(P)/FAD-dependent oxidoreductase [Mycolicibacterium aurantiacum]